MYSSIMQSYLAYCCIIFMQRYRSGHNGADSKSVCEQSHEGSNPSLCAKAVKSAHEAARKSLWLLLLKL